MYSLKKFKHLDNNYVLVELNDKVKNNFLSSFLIGIDNKFLKLNATDLNESTNYYKDKLNDKIMKKFDGKKFNKLNKNHLAYLADLCKMNLVIFDLNKLNLKFSTDLDKKNKTVYLFKHGKKEYLLMKKNVRSMVSKLPVSIYEQFGGMRTILFINKDESIKYFMDKDESIKYFMDNDESIKYFMNNEFIPFCYINDNEGMKELILVTNINRIDNIENLNDIEDYYEYEEIIVYRIGSKPMEENISYYDKIIELIGNNDVYNKILYAYHIIMNYKGNPLFSLDEAVLIYNIMNNINTDDFEIRNKILLNLDTSNILAKEEGDKFKNLVKKYQDVLEKITIPNFYNKLEGIIHQIIIDKSEMDTKQLNPREYQGLDVNISDELLIEQTAEKCYEFLIEDKSFITECYEYVRGELPYQEISLDKKMISNIIDKDECVSLFNDIIYNLVGDGIELEKNIYDQCKNYNTLGNEYIRDFIIRDFIIDSIQTYINDIIDRNDVLPNVEGLNDVQINTLQENLADFLTELFYEQTKNKKKHTDLFISSSKRKREPRIKTKREPRIKTKRKISKVRQKPVRVPVPAMGGMKQIKINEQLEGGLGISIGTGFIKGLKYLINYFNIFKNYLTSKINASGLLMYKYHINRSPIEFHLARADTKHDFQQKYNLGITCQEIHDTYQYTTPTQIQNTISDDIINIGVDYETTYMAPLLDDIPNMQYCRFTQSNNHLDRNIYRSCEKKYLNMPSPMYRDKIKKDQPKKSLKDCILKILKDYKIVYCLYDQGTGSLIYGNMDKKVPLFTMGKVLDGSPSPSIDLKYPGNPPNTPKQIRNLKIRDQNNYNKIVAQYFDFLKPIKIRFLWVWPDRLDNKQIDIEISKPGVQTISLPLNYTPVIPPSPQHNTYSSQIFSKSVLSRNGIKKLIPQLNLSVPTHPITRILNQIDNFINGTALQANRQYYLIRVILTFKLIGDRGQASMCKFYSKKDQNCMLLSGDRMIVSWAATHGIDVMTSLPKGKPQKSIHLFSKRKPKGNAPAKGVTKPINVKKSN